MKIGNSIVNMSAAAAAAGYCIFMVSTVRLGRKWRHNVRNTWWDIHIAGHMW